MTGRFPNRAPALLPVILLVLWGSAWAGLLRFPLTNERCPTSSFGSWRAGHLHAGLDFSTGGVTGVPVLAVDSCCVWRIRLWHGGYGKALYVELRDGKTAVYGHLSRFIPEIEALVEARQDLDGKYDVELLFDPGFLTFGPGDTLAYSGETGSGPPHLHFELRSGRDDHDKINPVPDHMDLVEGSAPTVKSVKIVPLDASSSVDGIHGPVKVVPGRGSSELRISGRFGVSVEAVDPAQCGRILVPIHYGAWIDEVPVWKLELDRFPFAKADLVGGLYEIVGGSKFVRLFDPYNLDLTGFTCLKPAGPAETGFPGPGRHSLSIKVGDPWGNSDEVTLPFLYGSLPFFRRFELNADSGRMEIQVRPEPGHSTVELAWCATGEWMPVEVLQTGDSIAAVVTVPDSFVEVRCRLRNDMGLEREGVFGTGGKVGGQDTVEIETAVHTNFIEILGKPSRPPSSLPVAAIHSESRLDSVVFQPVGRDLFRATYVPDGEVGSLMIESEFELGEQTVRDSVDLDVRLLLPGGEVWFSGSSYKVRLRAPETYSLRNLVSVSESAAESRTGFVSASGRLNFESPDVFFNDGIEVLVVRRDGNLTAHHGVFAESGTWVSLCGRFDEKGTCEFRTRQPEVFVILKDVEAPEIHAVADFRQRPSDGKATFRSRVTDAGSGVEAASLRGLVDDTAAILGIDPDTGRISGRTTKALQYGEHRIRLEAKDRMGNRATREFTVVLSR